MSLSLTFEYIPTDRLVALAKEIDIPEQNEGAVLFADISGFVALTNALTQKLGARRAAEVLTQQLNRVYDTIISQVDNYGGSVISFAGDAIICWFDADDAPLRAVACGFAMKQAMEAFSEITLPDGDTAKLSIKVTAASGTARRFIVGDKSIQLMDALVGATVKRAVVAQNQARSGEFIVDKATVKQLSKVLECRESWIDDETGIEFVVARRLRKPVEHRPIAIPADEELGRVEIRQWLLPAVFERLQSGLGEFLTELRPTVVIFVCFDGIDYDDDPDAHEKLDRFVSWVQQTVQRYNGHVLQLIIGDKGSYLYIAFGAPIAHQNDVWRACTVALALRALPPDLQFIEGPYIGMARGTVLTGAYGGANRRTYGIIGDEVNLAARLMQAAQEHALKDAEEHGKTAKPLSEIFYSNLPRQTLRSKFNFDEIKGLPIKGKSQSLHAYRLLGSKELPDSAAHLPMFGREAELAQMLAELQHALGGNGQVVGIAGEAGIGKSRLIAEFLNEVQQRGLTVFAGECQSYSTNRAYFVWQQLLSNLFRLQPFDSPQLQMEKLEAELKRLDPALLSSLPLLADILNLPFEDNEFTRNLEPKLRKSALEVLVLDCLQLLTDEARDKGKAIILVFEDVHWIDPVSLDLWALVVRAAAEWSLLAVITYRASDTHKEVFDIIEELSHFTMLSLNKMSDTDIQQLVRRKAEQLELHNIPDDLLQHVIEQAEGNPFYIEEWLYYLQDYQGDIKAIDRDELPLNLAILVFSRIDQLNERQKITLKVASIIGRRFQLKWLAGYFPELGKPEQIKADLDYLSKLEFTLIDQQGSDVVYLFRHMTTHQVAYYSLTDKLRIEFHEKFAVYVERDHPELLDSLAYHYGLTANIPKQREYFRRAGDAAVQRFANVEAIEYFTKLLNLIPIEDLAVRYDLLQKRELAYHLHADREPQAKDIETLTQLAQELGDNLREAQAALRRAIYERGITKFEEAEKAAQKAVEFAASEKSLYMEIQGLIELGQALWSQAQRKSAQKHLQRALNMAEAYPRLQAYALRNLATVASHQGNLKKAHLYLEQALPLFRQVGERLGEATALSDLGNITFFEGDFSKALTYYEQALQISRAIGDRLGVCSILNNMGAVVADEKGDYLAAGNLLDESLMLARQIGEKLIETQALTNKGFYAAAQGDFPRATAFYHQALTIAEQTKNLADEGNLLNNLGIVAASQGDYSNAQLLYDKSIKIKRDIESPSGESETLGFLGYLHLEQDDIVAARECTQQALTIAHDAEAGVEEARALKISGDIAIKMGTWEEAEGHYQQALEKYLSLGQTHSSIEPLTGLAYVAFRQEDYGKAISLVNEVLAHFSKRTADGLDYPIQVYLRCYQILEQGRDGRADRILQTAYQFMMSRATKIVDDKLRQSYLSSVTAHRGLLALWDTRPK